MERKRTGGGGHTSGPAFLNGLLFSSWTDGLIDLGQYRVNRQVNYWL